MDSQSVCHVDAREIASRRRSLALTSPPCPAQDVALATTDLRELSHSQLVDACYDRAVGRAGDTDAQLRAALSAWLKLVGEHADAEPQQLRLGALAVSAVAGARQAEDWNLPRLVYLGK